MKKFQFSLEKVIRHRQILENLAQAELMTAQAALNKEEQKLNDLVLALTAAKESKVHAQEQGGQAISTIQQINEFLKLQAILIEKQRAKVQEAEKEVEAKREILRIKAQDVKIIEKLKEKKKEEFFLELNKEEQNEMDERASLRFISTQDEDL